MRFTIDEIISYMCGSCSLLVFNEHKAVQYVVPVFERNVSLFDVL